MAKEKKDNSAGKTLHVETKDHELEGTVVNTQGKEITLKLPSGYNVLVNQDDILSKKILGQAKNNGKIIAKKIPEKNGLPKICILQVGGTIASRVDYKTGAVKVDFEPSELLHMFPELGEIANFDATAIARVFSEDMRFAHYKKIALAIKKQAESKNPPKGIIVAHGTDTMHYTSAALAFMLENPPFPVILVGAQRSTDRGSSDTATNLISAAHFIAKTGYKGVGICMHETPDDTSCVILPPAKTRKMHSSRRDSFRAINATPIARVNPQTGEVTMISAPQKNQGEFAVKPKMEEKIGLLKSHPNLDWREIDFYRKNKYKGLVIEGTGMGHIPIGVEDKETQPNKKNLAALKKLTKSGCIVAMTTQCIFGEVSSHVYSTGVELQEAGIVSAKDMLTETAFIKLSWLLGNYKPKEARELFTQNLRGEINDRHQMNYFPPKDL
ncbi:MAG: Glu-tRNA(Gln) amidotransferase subunit GatD [archaeon]|nr:Glu-tRNA(Gln) amidotransferase subunit GatD [archaeon]